MFRITLTEENKEVFEEAQRIRFLVCAFTNPQMFPFDREMSIPEAERRAAISQLESMFEDLMSQDGKDKNYTV